ncbi:MAG: hypothetical protein HQ569_09400 [Actinobacteria bacterium]|nr:hypothetical protein [Actinomycetota bacterium]
MEEKKYQASFLPWVGIENKFQIGPIKFTPLNKAFEKIEDSSIKEHLAKFFESYVDHQGKPVETILLCSYLNMDFHYLTEEEYNELMNAVNILVFCTIAPAIKRAVCADNRSMGPPSTEIFQLITQNFQPGINHIAVQAGSSISGGWEIGEITFSKPWATGGSFGTPDKELIQGFCKVFDAKFSNDVRERVFRSLEWFRMSHVENYEVSMLSKIVMMATAFEILLQVPNTPNKKQWIAEEIEKRISNSYFLKETRKDPKGNNHTYSRVAWWSWDFYKIRNSIVHGDYVKPECIQYCSPNIKWLTHLIVADLVFWECAKRELFNHRCIGDNVYSCAKEWDKAYPKEPQGTSIEPLARLFLGFDDVHKSLGWIKENEV